MTAGPTRRATVRRSPARGRYERETIDAILDEALFCHLAFADGGQPYVIPTIHARSGDTLYLHGAAANRALRALESGAEACLVATLIDGLVLARSAFHHSMNYRSVVVYGRPRRVTDPDEKSEALRALVEHVVPGRSRHAREPSPLELRSTLVLALPLDEASAKLRVGPPVDEEDDYALDVWAGEIPLRLVAAEPVPDPRLRAGIATPDYALQYRRPSAAPGEGST